MSYPHENRRCNVVLITVDSWRADYVGLYNPKFEKEGISHHLDTWAKSGKSVVFSRAITQSSHTSPAFLALLSGNYPSKYGDWFNVVSDNRPMMAEIFRQNGYHTYAFNSNPYISHYFHFDRGFDFFQDNMTQVSTEKSSKDRLIALSRLKALLKEPYENAATINHQVLEQWSKFQTPYFLWVHYMDVHGPYIPKKGWSTQNRIKAAYLWKKSLKDPGRITPRERAWLIKSYKEEIAYLDQHLSELIRRLDQDNTLLILTADHGDLFGEHQHFGHTLQLYNGLLHVPLIMKFPSNFDITASNIKTSVRSMDLLPTLVDLLKLDGVSDISFDGSSYASLLSSSPRSYSNDSIISEVSRKHLCIEKNGWKLIVNYKANWKKLFNLSEDPAEESNVLEQHRDIADAYEDILQEHVKVNSVYTSGASLTGHNEAMKERLRALGYFE